MGPLCTSLIQQYLKSTSSSLADQFKEKYQPFETKAELKEVMVNWEEEQMARSLVYKHMKSVSSALASEFKVIYRPLETKVQLDEVLLKLKEEQLATSLVFHHLKSVAPSLWLMSSRASMALLWRTHPVAGLEVTLFIPHKYIKCALL